MSHTTSQAINAWTQPQPDWDTAEKVEIDAAAKQKADKAATVLAQSKVCLHWSPYRACVIRAFSEPGEAARGMCFFSPFSCAHLVGFWCRDVPYL